MGYHVTPTSQSVDLPRLRPGTEVEVRSSLSTWSVGFRVAQVGIRGYRLRRLSDGQVLPTEFGFDRVRRA